MKISEFKGRLNQLEEVYGDVEVMIDYPDRGGWEPADAEYHEIEGYVEVY
ncbi:hypothetical protein [Weissella confusa]|nr:hypothetical protein [Weissella confusa]